MIITMAHGGGGRETARLINDIFAKAFGSDATADAAELRTRGRLAYTTDSFVVTPLFFKGGDIGRLAVCGTVNDLCTAGAEPLFLSAGFIIEDGAEIKAVAEIARSMRAAADEAGVRIVTGDTKVIEGSGGVYINTSGIGALPRTPWNPRRIREGDAIIVTGALGDHHAAILSGRMGIENGITSDVSPLTGITAALKNNGCRVHAARDITRGGLAACLNELADAAGLRAVIREADIPVNAEVGGLCAILGLEPLYMANEGKLLVIAPKRAAKAALAAIRAAEYGGGAAVIGEFTGGRGVALETAIGGRRVLPPPVGESLPRIC